MHPPLKLNPNLNTTTYDIDHVPPQIFDIKASPRKFNGSAAPPDPRDLTCNIRKCLNTKPYSREPEQHNRTIQNNNIPTLHPKLKPKPEKIKPYTLARQSRLYYAPTTSMPKAVHPKIDTLKLTPRSLNPKPQSVTSVGFMCLGT